MSLRKPRSELCVEKLYEGVIGDVVAGTRETLLNAGIDEQVVEEFQRLWQAKVLASKAVEHKTPSEDGEGNSTAGKVKRELGNEPSSFGGSKRARQSVSGRWDDANPGLVAGASAPVIRAEPHTLIPIHITVPRHANDTPGTQKNITINIPASCVYSNMLQELLTRPSVQALLKLPNDQAAEQLEAYVVNASKKDEKPYVIPGYATGGTTPSTSSQSKSGGSARNQRSLNSANNANGINQSDGQNDYMTDDTSTDESEDDDEVRSTDDEFFSADDGEVDLENVEWNEEPLNSGDDCSDPEDNNEKIFSDIKDEIVCNYEKITRNRDKWTFHLREGIMNISGKDYAFQKAYGESKW